MPCTETMLLEVIAQHGGVLAKGSHLDDYGDPDCPLCILEAHAACLVARGELDKITDDPAALGRPDYRAINDACWSSRGVATPHLIRLHMAYEGWRDWPTERRVAVVGQIALETVRQIVSALPYLPPEIAKRCREAKNAAYAAAAAYAAYAAAADAAYAAARAADADAAIADAARAAADKTLILAVDIWVAAAGASATAGSIA